MNKLTLLSAASVVALFSVATAQGTITNGQVSYTVGSIGSTQSDSVGSNFTTNPAADSDVLFEHWFFYRIGNDTDERAFRNDGTLSQSYSGSHADLDWSDVDGRGLISANLDIDVVSTSSTAGRAVFQMTFRNISASPIVLDFFTYADLDVCGTANTVTGSGSDHLVMGSCGEDYELIGRAIDNWCVAQFSGSECGIVGSGIIDLPNGSLPFSGDYSGAMQWRDRSLQPGAMVTFTSELCGNCNQCPNRATSVNYGNALGGAGGLPTITTTQLPVLGQTGQVTVGNVVPLTSGAMFIGIGRANTQVGNLTILINNVLDTPIIQADAGGSLQLSLPVPLQLCGARLGFQYFFVDGTVQGAFPIAHTDGLEWTLGS